MNAYQLVMIIYESLIAAPDQDAFEQWFGAADLLADRLKHYLPADALCNRVIGGAVLAALPESDTKKASDLEKELKPQVEAILGPTYTVKLFYTNYLVPENSIEIMIQHAVDRYEHSIDPNEALIALDLGEELPETSEQEVHADWARLMLQGIADGQYESVRLLFLQIMTMFKFHRSNVLTHTFLGLSMSTLIILSGSMHTVEAEHIAHLLNASAIGPDWQSFVLHSLEEICRHRRNYRGSRFDSFEQRVHDYVDHEVVDSKLDLKKTAENFGLTPTYFSQQFKEHMGVGFQSYVEQMRMQIGYDLLRQHDMTVSRAARECGYSNVGTFRRNFKKHFGVNPGDIMG